MSDLQIPFSSAEIDSFFSVWSCVCLLVGFSIQWVTFRRVRPGTIFSQYKTFPPPHCKHSFQDYLFLESVTRPAASPFPLFPSVCWISPLEALGSVLAKDSSSFSALSYLFSLKVLVYLQQGGIKECFLLLAPRQTEWNGGEVSRPRHPFEAHSILKLLLRLENLLIKENGK